MPTNLTILLFCLLPMLLLFKETHAKTVVAATTTDSPTPAPAPAPAQEPQPNKVTKQPCFYFFLLSCVDFVPVFLFSHSMGALKAVFNHKNVVLVVRRDVQRHSTRNLVCSSARSVVPNVCVFPLEPMATRKYVPATTTGRPKGEDPNALESSNFHNLRFLSIDLKTKKLPKSVLHSLCISINISN
ncbi:hypothetical protein VIGAN_08323700 [Vigna angularis var. angularis]|uniref:Uncharacterized protein n=1 Tax=Vigna angularis var. angularis TaxID=157739 RepID=A0A0S3SU11_PHAAN|nr:hypothetical protein VIGAN_08323700 [Vigna angularis var. angularis]